MRLLTSRSGVRASQGASLLQLIQFEKYNGMPLHMPARRNRQDTATHHYYTAMQTQTHRHIEADQHHICSFEHTASQGHTHHNRHPPDGHDIEKTSAEKRKQHRSCNLSLHSELLRERAHPDLNQGPADLQSAALTTELCTHVCCMHLKLL